MDAALRKHLPNVGPPNRLAIRLERPGCGSRNSRFRTCRSVHAPKSEPRVGDLPTRWDATLEVLKMSTVTTTEKYPDVCAIPSAVVLDPTSVCLGSRRSCDMVPMRPNRTLRTHFRGRLQDDLRCRRLIVPRGILVGSGHRLGEDELSGLDMCLSSWHRGM